MTGRFSGFGNIRQNQAQGFFVQGVAISLAEEVLQKREEELRREFAELERERRTFEDQVRSLKGEEVQAVEEPESAPEHDYKIALQSMGKRTRQTYRSYLRKADCGIRGSITDVSLSKLLFAQHRSGLHPKTIQGIASGLESSSWSAV